MEDLPYAIVAILAFWVLLVMGFITLICRMRMRRTDAISNQAPSSKRIIQIYYIGNWDYNNSTPTLSPTDMLTKVLARIEDHPPSYDEISANGTLNNISMPNKELSEYREYPMTQAGSSVPVHSHAVSSTSIAGNSHVVVLVEGNRDAPSI